MGRTIVLPPAQPFYLFQDRRQKFHFTFHDFFHLNEAQLEHAGIKIISTTRFLERVIEEGLLKNKTTGLISFPPYNRTDWENKSGIELKELYGWLEETAYVKGWNTNKCIAFWPNDTSMDPSSIDRIESLMKVDPKKSQYVGIPVPVNASAKDRLAEQLVGRKEVCLYHDEMQREPVVHFKFAWNADEKSSRFLAPFYTFNFYEDWENAIWMKRFIRDHLRYHDELICATARVVDGIRQRVRQRGLPDNPDELFNVSKFTFWSRSALISCILNSSANCDIQTLRIQCTFVGATLSNSTHLHRRVQRNYTK